MKYVEVEATGVGSISMLHFISLDCARTGVMKIVGYLRLQDGMLLATAEGPVAWSI